MNSEPLKSRFNPFEFILQVFCAGFRAIRSYWSGMRAPSDPEWKFHNTRTYARRFNLVMLVSAGLIFSSVVLSWLFVFWIGTPSSRGVYLIQVAEVGLLLGGVIGFSLSLTEKEAGRLGTMLKSLHVAFLGGALVDFVGDRSLLKTSVYRLGLACGGPDIVPIVSIVIIIFFAFGFLTVYTNNKHFLNPFTEGSGANAQSDDGKNRFAA